jgi:HPt (histidine-containing phosphotransfer) domain-containing protein
MVDQVEMSEDDEKLDFQLKSDFVKLNKNRFEELKESLELNDIKRAHLLAHTVKGNAALLKKNRLQKAAAELERMLEGEKNNASREALALFKAELEQVLSEFKHLDRAASHTPKKELNVQQMKELIEKIKPLVKSGRSECLDFVEEIMALPDSEYLVEQLEDFEFDLAYKTLQEIEMSIK